MHLFSLLTTLLLLLLPAWSHAGTATEMEVGLRGGADDSGHNLEERYVAAELYFLKQLPWGTRIGEQTTLTTRFDMGVTYLEARDDEGMMLAAGVDLVLGLRDGATELEVGFRPTWMHDKEYGKDDYGGGIQFSSHVGLAVNWQPLSLNYRFQHTSNGGRYDVNPGLNLHLVGLGYRF